MKRIIRVGLIIVTLLAAQVCFDGNGFADQIDHTIQIGVRPGIIGSDGEPSNDMPMIGVYGRYRLNDDWLVGAALDYSEFDFERPNRLLGLKESKEEDAVAEGIYVSVMMEREFMQHSDSMRPFVSANLGIGIIDVPDVIIPLEGGGEADIKTDAGTEIIPGVTVGIRFLVGENLFIEPAARLDYHFTEWDVIDRNTGQKTTVDDYLTWGGYVGVGWRF